MYLKIKIQENEMEKLKTNFPGNPVKDDIFLEKHIHHILSFVIFNLRILVMVSI